MSVKILPSSEVRDHMASLIKEFEKDDSPCFITQHGRASAVLMAISRYNAIMSLLEDLEDEEDSLLGKRVAEARKHYAAGGGIPFKKYLKEREKK